MHFTHRKQCKHLRCLHCMHSVKSLLSALSRRCSAVGGVAGHLGTSADMSGLKDQSFRTRGPNCLGITTELSQKVSMPKCLGANFRTGAEVSRVRTVLAPM